jgi:hypothetical protein
MEFKKFLVGRTDKGNLHLYQNSCCWERGTRMLRVTIMPPCLWLGRNSSLMNGMKSQVCDLVNGEGKVS